MRCSDYVYLEDKHFLYAIRLPANNVLYEVRLQLFALAYNLGNFLWRLALPRKVKPTATVKVRACLSVWRPQGLKRARFTAASVKFMNKGVV